MYVLPYLGVAVKLLPTEWGLDFMAHFQRIGYGKGKEKIVTLQVRNLVDTTLAK